jgi:uncharacterized membrane protein YgdD (TMEM256/DUF423 family)
MQAAFWIAAGSVSGFIAVGCGAFGAHALAARLEPRMLEIWQTGAQYQMFHALALLGLGTWQSAQPAVAATPGAQAAGWAFVVGTALFSGSLYALALSGVRALGAITPLGGVAFLVGWACLAWTAIRASG